MISGIVPGLFVLAFAAILMMACSSDSVLATVKQTFVPMTKREFWFPPCPFCWVARGAAIYVLYLIAASAISPASACMATFPA